MVTIKKRFISAYGEKIKVQYIEQSPGRTKQEFRDECDINNIMAQHLKGRIIDHYNKHGAQYGDVTQMDFLEAMLTVKQGQEMFDDLPSNVRNRFNGSPGEFLNFVQNPENKSEMEKLGLLKREVTTGEVVKTEPVVKTTEPVVKTEPETAP